MFALFPKIRLLALCWMVSILIHLLLAYGLRMLGTYHFGAPVDEPLRVMVELADARPAVSAPVSGEKTAAPGTPKPMPKDAPVVNPPPPSPENNEKLAAPSPAAPPPEPQAVPEQKPVPEPAGAPVVAKGDTPPGAAGLADPPEPLARPVLYAAPALPPSSAGGEFPAAKYEKLNYVISMLGIPVGSAELESRNDNGLLSITLRVRSNAAMSNIFPVDNVVETHHIDGRFIVTKIRQQEASFRSDESFTINLVEKTVSWIDLIRNRSLKATLPTDDVLDTLSGIYSLRRRQLQVGRTVTLHIYDSEVYADVPVEILRKEQMRLPNLIEIATLVVRPLQKTAGIFRRTGDLLIWMTDDDHRVPVKIVTSIALGKVTAELVSAESSSRKKSSKSAPGSSQPSSTLTYR